MKFSVITPCFLGNYKNAGNDRERKLVRCVNSVMFQDYSGYFEQIVVADGCPRTKEIIETTFPDELLNGTLRLISIPKQRTFSGIIRNTGLEAAKGEWIVYLDADDIFGPDHLSVIEENLKTFDWVFFNDLVYNKEYFQERTCTLKHYNCGTSNIAHKRTMSARWKDKSGYGRDDWDFIQALVQESKNWAKIPTPEYVVCHIPLKTGYDL